MKVPGDREGEKSHQRERKKKRGKVVIVHKTLSCSSWVSTPVASSLFCTMYSWAGKQKLKGKGSLSVAKTFQFERGGPKFSDSLHYHKYCHDWPESYFLHRKFSPSVPSPPHLATLVVAFCEIVASLDFSASAESFL